MTTLIPEQFNDQFADMSAALRPDHIFCVYNSAGRLIFSSPTVHHLLGYSVDEFNEFNWAHMVEDDLTDRAEKYLEQSLEGEAAPAHNVLFEHKNGAHILMEARHRPVFDERGEVSRIESIFRDLTTRY